MTDIVFTDRYGGNPPSLLTVCPGQCEGMGCYPSNDPSEWPEGTRLPGTPEPDGTPDDGWRFIRCEECGGTGRVSMWRGLTRLPREWRRGAAFIRTSWNFYDGEYEPDEWPHAWKMKHRPMYRFWHLFKIAYVDDWLRLSRHTRRWAT